MIQIRAGILYNLAVDNIKKISDDSMRDLLFQNGVINKYVRYSYYFYLISEYTPDDCGYNYNNNRIGDLFNESADLFIELFESAGFSMDQILHMIEVLFEALYSYPDIKYDLIVDNWTRSHTIGMKYEEIAIDTLRNLGFNIAECEPNKKPIDDNIMLHGKADGVILDCPGNIYKRGTLIEIKYKGNKTHTNKRYYNKDMFQIASYSVIFDCDVLYVCIYEDKHIECELCTRDKLRDKFNDRLKFIVNNCKEIARMLASDDFTDITSIIDLCKHKKSKYSFAENID